MPEKHYPFYDTALFGTAPEVHTLFIEAEGSSAAKNSQFTNMRIGGQFAQDSDFLIEKLCVFVDDQLAEADIPLLYQECFIKIIIKNNNVLQIPLRFCADADSYSGVLNQAAASDFGLIGVQNKGFHLRKPIMVAGGEQFKVEVHQTVALNNADQAVKFMLDGMLNEN